MNERIRLLAVQAGLALKPRRPYDDKEPDGYLESDLDYLENNLEATRMFFEGGLEKFAQLIVEECFKAAMIESKGHMNPIDLIKRMKERVGVEK